MDNRSYSVDPELIHYGVKGMKWKDHKYQTNINGEYIYNNIGQAYRHVTGQDTLKDRLGRGARYITGQQTGTDRFNRSYDNVKREVGRGYRHLTGQETLKDRLYDAYDEAKRQINNVDRNSINLPQKLPYKPPLDGVTRPTMMPNRHPGAQSITKLSNNKKRNKKMAGPKETLDGQMKSVSKHLDDQKKRREAYLKSGVQRRQSNSGYGIRTKKTDSDYYNFNESSSDYGSSADRSRSSKYEKYVKETRSTNGNRTNLNTEVTYVKRGKKKRLVTKKTDMGSHETSISGLGSSKTTYKKVDPGRYDSYGDAARGETKRAVRVAKRSAKEAYRIGSGLTNKAAKQVKNVGGLVKKTTPDSYSKSVRRVSSDELKKRYHKYEPKNRYRRASR